MEPSSRVPRARAHAQAALTAERPAQPTRAALRALFASPRVLPSHLSEIRDLLTRPCAAATVRRALVQLADVVGKEACALPVLGAIDAAHAAGALTAAQAQTLVDVAAAKGRLDVFDLRRAGALSVGPRASPMRGALAHLEQVAIGTGARPTSAFDLTTALRAVYRPAQGKHVQALDRAAGAHTPMRELALALVATVAAYAGTQLQLPSDAAAAASGAQSLLMGVGLPVVWFRALVAVVTRCARAPADARHRHADHAVVER